MDTETSYDDIDFEVTSPAQELARVRDELRLKLHLARAEVRAQWEELEKNWVLLQSRLTVIKTAGKASSKDVQTAAKQLIAELKQGYERMRDALTRV